MSHDEFVNSDRFSVFYHQLFNEMMHENFFDSSLTFLDFFSMQSMDDVIRLFDKKIGDSLDLSTAMKMALTLAFFSIFPNQRGGPFGSVIIKNNRLLSFGANHVTIVNDPTDHGEVNAIRRALMLGHASELIGATLVTSTYPCPMCFSLAQSVGISTIVYCSTDDDAVRHGGFCDQMFWEEAQFKIRDNQSCCREFQLDGHVIYPDLKGDPLVKVLQHYCKMHGFEPSKLTVEFLDEPRSLTLFDYSALRWAGVTIPEHVGIEPYFISKMAFVSFDSYLPIGVSIFSMF